MELIPPAAPALSADDLAALGRAKRALESAPLTMKLASAVGAPVEKLIARLPAVANETLADATRLALEKCLQAALRTLGDAPSPATARAASADKPRDLLHKLAVATTGAAGGAFGLVALPAELPVTTTLMFRSICDIARSEGEDPLAIETQLQCLAVFGMGRGAARAKVDAKKDVSSNDLPDDGEDADLGYFVTRGALAQAVSKASSEFAAKGFTTHGSAALLRLVNTIAARFSVQVSEQIAAKSIPAIGAVLGALVNTVFMDHFQQMAHGHFAVRRLERRYGAETVAAAYRAIAV